MTVRKRIAKLLMEIAARIDPLPPPVNGWNTRTLYEDLLAERRASDDPPRMPPEFDKAKAIVDEASIKNQLSSTSLRQSWAVAEVYCTPSGQEPDCVHDIMWGSNYFCCKCGKVLNLN